MKGIVASTAGLAILLEEGIGDTIRVSLTPAPGGEREEEVRVAQQVLQSMGLRSFLPQVSACPGCGRTTSTFFQEMAERIQAPPPRPHARVAGPLPGRRGDDVAVMGCVVNGPGESKHADIGISLPGTFEEPVAPVFIDGKLDRTLRGDALVDEFIDDPRGLRRAALRRAAGCRRPPIAPDGTRDSDRRSSAGIRPMTFDAPEGRVYTPPNVNRPPRDVGDPHVFFRRSRYDQAIRRGGRTT